MSTFCKLKPRNCLYGKIRECKCPACRAGYDNRNAHEDEHALHKGKKDILKCADCLVEGNAERIEAEKQFCEHQRIFRTQRNFFNDLRESGLQDGECMLLMDFSPYAKGYVRLRGMGEAMCTIQCLHLVLYTKGAVSYYDYFSEENNDIYFVRRALCTFLERQDMKNLKILHFFSDGGGKHFRNRRSLGFVLCELPVLFPEQFDKDRPPTWHFFAGNHGKSACDARAAVVKTFFKRLAIQGEVIRGSVELASSVNTNMNQKLTHRNATVLGSISHEEEFDWTLIHDIRSFNCFQWTGRIENRKKKQYNTSNVMKESYEVQMRMTSFDSANTALFVHMEPFYRFDIDTKGMSLDITRSERMKQVKIVLNPGVASRIENFDDPNEEEEVVLEEYGRVREDHLVVSQNIRDYKAGTHIAVFHEEFDGERKKYIWYAAMVKRIQSTIVPGKRHDVAPGFRAPTYQKQLVVVFDDEREERVETVIDFNEEVRLVKKNEPTKVKSG
jgi:hypothetical protein